MCFDDYKTLNLLLMSYRSWSDLIYLYILKSAWKTVDRYTGNGRPLLTESWAIFQGIGTVDRQSQRGQPLTGQTKQSTAPLVTVDR